MFNSNTFLSKFVVVFISIILLLGCSTLQSNNEGEHAFESESTKANTFFNKSFQDMLKRHPEFQTYLGMKDNDDQWNILTDKFDQKELKIAKQQLMHLKKEVNPELLDEDTLVSYILFKTSLEDQIEDFKFRFHDYPVNQMFGTHADAPAFLINIHQITDVKDAKNYIDRLNNLSLYFDQLITQIEHRESLGIMPPKFVFAKVLDDSNNIITGRPFDQSQEDSTLYADFKNKVSKLDIDSSTKETLIASATQALLQNVEPAYKKLIIKLETQQKIATTDDGVWKLPNGTDFYNNQLKRITTTDMDAESIHQLGLKEVVRIHGEMRKIKDKVGFKGNLKQFFKFMREDKQFYYPNTDKGRDAYLTSAKKIINDMKGKLDTMFITQPKADLIVKKVEAFREKSAGSAFYEQPSLDGSRPGIYYANLYNMEAMPIYQKEALAYHEGVPGHHMQISMAQEFKNIPLFRKFISFTAYIEGWGLYSEYLPKEFGGYQDPYSDFGRLAMELWRACRLVVDTGIHTKKWTRQQGIDYYSNNTPDSLIDVVRMVERHIVMPGQATAYKIGMNKILQLREHAKQQLGNAFDIRAFHEQILNGGALPLTMLEEKIDRWITSTKETITESKKANDFFAQWFQSQLNRSPEFQSYLGIKKDADKWDEYTDASQHKELEFDKKTLNELHQKIDPEKLDSNTLLSYQLLEKQLLENIEDFKFRLHSYPVNQMFGVHSHMASFLINIHQIKTVKDAENYISRLEGISTVFNQLIDNLKLRQSKGVVAPQFAYPKIIESSKNIITGKPFVQSNKDSTLYADFNKKINKLNGLNKQQKNELLQQARLALVNHVYPAYQKLIAFLGEQQKVATNNHGVWSLPNGDEYYNVRLKRRTTTDYTAEKIHKIGLSEVKRIHDEMRAIMHQVAFKGDLPAFFKFMRDDSQFYYDDTKQGRETYIKEATDLIDTMKTKLDSLFITKPKAGLIVKAVEPYREKSAGKAFYQRPALDGSRPGTYYANLYDMKAMPTYQMEALAYHEGIPGHHMQLSIAQELKGIPTFRKYATVTAYTEGWGLYSEFLPKEMGFYKDPYSDFGRLAMELWRACRLVVDTGIHKMKWTREQGIDYYAKNTPNAVSDAVKMVERHFVMPGQATAYKIGMLKIQELRKMAKSQLGDKFDIRQFHEQVLNGGPVPLDVLEASISLWVKTLL